jgi:hypothetical protein
VGPLRVVVRSDVLDQDPDRRLAAGPLHAFYKDLLAKERKPTMAQLTLARKIAAITLIVWKKEVRFDANHLKQQAA